MRVLLAPDSYKDAVSANQATAALARGVYRGCPDIDIDECPMGDGGEGTLNAILVATQAYQQSAKVRDALGRTCEASWGWHPGTQTAFIELAEACGLQKLAMDERTALYSSTYGVGELICRALDHGAKRILLLLGGSATNDAGAGMLQALGAKLTDARGDPLPGGGVHLTNLDKLNLSGLDPRLREISIEAAIDVDNPLVGHQGASVVFGPQKGASSAEVAYLDTSLKHFADITTRTLNTDYRNLPGAGRQEVLALRHILSCRRS